MRSSVPHTSLDSTLVSAHVLLEVIVTTEVLPASSTGHLCVMTGSPKSAQSPDGKKKEQTHASRWYGSIAHVASNVRRERSTCYIRRPRTCTFTFFLHTTLHHEHWCRGHTAAARLLCGVQHGHGRTQTTRTDRVLAAAAGAS